MDTGLRNRGVELSPDTSSRGTTRPERIKLVVQIVRQFPHPHRKGHVNWKKAFQEHPDWKQQLGVMGDNFQPAYNLCTEIFGHQHSFRQLLHEVVVGGYYVRLYAVEADDSFWLDWKLPDGGAGSKTYINEEECLRSLAYCEKELAAIDPEAVAVGTLSALRP